MKKITRLLSLLLIVAVVLSMNLTVTVFADDYTITINNVTSDKDTYAAYQIFKGDLYVSALSNIEWGDGVDLTKTATVGEGTSAQTLTLLQALQAIEVTDPQTAQKTVTPFAGLTTAAKIAEVLSSDNYNGNNSELAQTFADVVGQYLSSTSTSGTYSDTNSTYKITIDEAEPGYYLVKNTAVASGSAYTRFILLVVGDVSATPKRDVPTLEKHVVDTNDTNDTEGTSTDFQDSADHDIGDYIYYELVGTIIDDTTEYAAYDTYKMVFNDTLSKGLDFKNTTEYPLTVVAEVDGTKQTIPATITYNQESKTNYTIAGPTDITDPTDDYYEGESFTVTFDDVKTLYYYTDPDDPDTATALTVTAGSTITVHYYAYLNSDAVIGSAGNPNVAYLEYSNNPNSGGGGDLGETPKDKNIVFTYELDVTKVISGTSTGLNGAGFTLFKKVSSAPTLSTYSETFDGTYGGTAPTNVTKYYAKDASDTIYYVDATDSVYYKMIKTITLDSAYEFAFTGIDDGTYLLVETKTPSGYNTIDPVPFTVTATHTNDNDPTALALTDLTVTDGNSSNPLNGTATTSTGKIAASIGNAAGAVMPSTGGMGTKIFYTLGGILVVCAGVLLIVKRRMRNS